MRGIDLEINSSSDLSSPVEGEARACSHDPFLSQ